MRLDWEILDRPRVMCWRLGIGLHVVQSACGRSVAIGHTYPPSGVDRNLVEDGVDSSCNPHIPVSCNCGREFDRGSFGISWMIKQGSATPSARRRDPGGSEKCGSVRRKLHGTEV